jgi:sugar/nucleoside kinase (ribokinase family)
MAYVAPCPLPQLRPPRPSRRLPGRERCRPKGGRRCRLSASASPPPVPVPPFLSQLKVVGLGGCGVDMIAVVPSFPRADAKIRTTSTLATGGGNCANTLTALRRLGLPTALIAKVGDDAHGAAVVKELSSDGVDTANVLVKARMHTPFTYVIVDAEHGTRTCIHTPADEDVLSSDLALSPDGGDDVLAGASLVVLDGRHTLAAISLARAANERNIPVLMDVERDRPHLETLLQHCDYLVTSSSYPSCAHPAAAGRVDAMTRLLLRSGRAKAVVTTMGEGGATVVLRDADDVRDRGARDPQLVVTRERIAAAAVGRFGAGASARGEVEEGGGGVDGCGGEVVVLQCPAWPVANVVDTCGAGDAFVGGIAYGICVGLSVEGWLGLATRVAARQIGMLGARAGLPRREELDAALLTALPKFN